MAGYILPPSGGQASEGGDTDSPPGLRTSTGGSSQGSSQPPATHPSSQGWGAHSTTPGDGVEEASAHWYETGLCFVTLDKDLSLSETGGRVTTPALASVQARAF